MNKFFVLILFFGLISIEHSSLASYDNGVILKVSFSAFGKGDKLKPTIIEISPETVKIVSYDTMGQLKSRSTLKTSNTEFLRLIEQLPKDALNGYRTYSNCSMRDGGYIRLVSQSGDLKFVNVFNANGTLKKQASFCDPFPKDVRQYSGLVAYVYSVLEKNKTSQPIAQADVRQLRGFHLACSFRL